MATPSPPRDSASPEIGNFLDPATLSDPYDFYQQLHARDPVHLIPGLGMYMVSRYDDVREVLRDSQRFSNDPVGSRSPDRPESDSLHQQILRERGWAHTQTLQRTDPPAHVRYRKLVNRVFTQRQVRGMLGRIEAVANGLIDGFIERGSCEFVGEYAMPMPGILIAEQLGLARDEIKTFKRWADAMLAPATRPMASDDEIREVAEVELEAQHYLAKVFEERRAEPRDDLISGLVHAHGDDESNALSMRELQNLLHQLITGGFETTMSALAHGLWQLLRFPDQLALLRANPSLLDAFVEESLRFESPVQGLMRRTTCDVEMHGVTIPKDSMVIPRYGAANRDASKFPDPDRFDIRRENADQHMAFGLGTHFCVGAALGRQEIKTTFELLLERLDEIELDGPMPDPVHDPSIFFLPMKELRIRFRARG
jgi:cytochrome P450